MHGATHDRFVEIDITIPDFQVKAAIRIGANPGLIFDRCPLTAKIRQGHQVSRFTLLAFGEINLFHGVHLPAKFMFFTVYTKQHLLARAITIYKRHTSWVTG